MGFYINVPGHRRYAGAGGAGEIDAKGNPANFPRTRPERGGNERARLRADVVESFLLSEYRPRRTGNSAKHGQCGAVVRGDSVTAALSWPPGFSAG